MGEYFRLFFGARRTEHTLQVHLLSRYPAAGEGLDNICVEGILAFHQNGADKTKTIAQV